MCAGTLTLPQSWQDETRERAVQIERKGGGGSMLTCDQGSTARLRTCTTPIFSTQTGVHQWSTQRHFAQNQINYVR
jgi:hypothetical protein